MFEEHKAEQEAYFSGPAVMSASHRRALIYGAVYSRSEIKEIKEIKEIIHFYVDILARIS
jgi:hypothetical protein